MYQSNNFLFATLKVEVALNKCCTFILKYVPYCKLCIWLSREKLYWSGFHTKTTLFNM
uniref:Uncharacterized protein n=1 Tax=Anguilla anguilla TaxID=7936 RepID=A0A0E9XGT4_ANGAN